MRVTFVHGTFGRRPGGTKWMEKGSAIRHALASEFAGVDFQEFRWSGRNSPKARERAAAELRHAIVRSDPESRQPQFLIAHSHGGNVALQATQTDDAASRLAGIICLATPFIVAQPRALTAYARISTYAVMLVSIFALVANLLARPISALQTLLAPQSSMLRVLLYNEIWLEFMLSAVIAWRATRALEQLARDREQQITLRGIPVPLAIFRSIGDEASAALGTSAFLSWLVVLLWRAARALTTAVAATAVALALFPLTLVVIAVLLGEAVFSRRSTLRLAFARLLARPAVGVVLTTLGLLLCYAAWGFLFHDSVFATAEQVYGWAVLVFFITVLILAQASGLGYGLTVPFLEVTAETTPIGRWEVHLLPARRSTGPEKLLAHGSTYDDPEALRQIAEWIRVQLERPPTSD